MRASSPPRAWRSTPPATSTSRTRRPIAYARSRRPGKSRLSPALPVSPGPRTAPAVNGPIQRAYQRGNRTVGAISTSPTPRTTRSAGCRATGDGHDRRRKRPAPPPAPVNVRVFSFPRGVAVTAAGRHPGRRHRPLCDLPDHGRTAACGLLYGLTGESGTVDGSWNTARFTAPTGITVAPSGDLLITEASSNPSVARVRRITGDGMVTTVAGAEEGYADGQGTAGRFNRPVALAADGSGNVFVADTYNQVVRMVSSAGVVSTVAGLVDAPGSSDGTGTQRPLLRSAEASPIDGNGTLFVSSNGTSGPRVHSPRCRPFPSNPPAKPSRPAAASRSASRQVPVRPPTLPMVLQRCGHQRRHHLDPQPRPASVPLTPETTP